jgi:hypothetical protein
VTTISNAVLRVRGRLSDATEPSVLINVLNAVEHDVDRGRHHVEQQARHQRHGARLVHVTGTTAQNYDINLTSFLQAELAAGARR